MLAMQGEGPNVLPTSSQPLTTSSCCPDGHPPTPCQVAAAFDSAAGLRGLLMAGESDAWLSLGLMFHLSGGAV
jgi:hypothetical protein